MQRIPSRPAVVATILATLVVGLTGAGTAHADGTLSVTPATGLADGQQVTIEIDGFTPTALTTVQFAECGNAYANNDPLEAMPSVMPGVLDARNCEVIRFTSPGDITTSPFSVNDAVVSQTGIGTGNRSCISAPPAIAPCFVYVSTSVNLPVFPEVPITFTDPLPTGGEPAATTTTVAAIGSPIADGKTAHALVTVAAVDPSLHPEGDVEVFEGTTSLGTATLAADATANVNLGVLAFGSHELTAHYVGNGSFYPSDTSSAATMSVISPTNISIGDASLVEGDSSGTRAIDMRIVTFPVVLSQPSPVPLSVNYSIVPVGGNNATIGPAAAVDTDIVAASGIVKFLALKQTVKYVNVKVKGDVLNEGDETFAVQLSNPVPNSYVLRKSEGLGTIIDDDAPTAGSVTVGLGASSVPEGDIGNARAMKFTVTLTSPVLTDTIVTVQMSNVTAVRGTKLTGDWGGAINKNLKMRAGTVTKSLVVPAFADQNDELDEVMRVRVLAVSAGVTLGTHIESFGTILSDE